MNPRWRSVRERLAKGVPLPKQVDAWDRVAASRRVGGSVTLPVQDRRARPGVVLTLLGAGVVSLGFIASRPPADHVVAAEPPSGLDGWDWLVPPAYAQVAAPSSLPAIDPLDLARIRPGRWVYSRRSGVDSVVTSVVNFDTVRVARDSATGVTRLVAVRVVPQRRVVDSLVLFGDGPDSVGMMRRIGHYRDATRYGRIETVLSPDTLRLTGYPSNGGPPRTHVIAASWPLVVEELLPSLLPAIALNEHYARSLNVLDLLGGETRNAGRPYEMRVVGTTSVRTPAGRFDCWVVEVKTLDPGSGRALTHRLKIARSNGVLVQATWDEWHGFFREDELVLHE